MTKYTRLFQQQVVDFYFEIQQNLSLTLRQFPPNTTVKDQIVQYHIQV